MVKFILAILIFLTSLLVLFPAPHIAFWKLSVGLTSFPYVPILLSLALIIATFYGGKYIIPTLVLSSVAMGIFFMPIVQAVKLNATVHADLQQAFPLKNEVKHKQAFRFFNMFSASQQVPYKTYSYKKVAAQNLTFDFYAASTTADSAPLIIVIHGGSWQSGDSKQLPELNSYLALQGYHVAAINYSLAPAYMVPTPEYDTKAAVAYFILNYKLHKIDTNRIILLGRSAGAQIALCAAYKFKIPNVKGVINFYGPADMVWAGKLAPNAGVLDNNTIYNNYLGGLYKEVPNKFEASTAVLQADSFATPTLTIHGQIDPLVFKTHAEHLHKRLVDVGVPNYYLKLYNATHGCDYSLQSPAGQLSTYAVLHFIKYTIQ